MSADARDEALVEVAVALPVRGTFHYRIPEHLRDALRFGHAVIVPFGKRHVTGFVVADPGADAPDDAPTDTELKPIEDLLAPDPLFGPRDWDLYSFMARFYLAPLGEALRTALPPGIFQTSRRHVRLTDAGRAALRTEAPAKRARAVLQVLSAKGEMRLESLLKSAEGVGVASLAQMAAHGWIEIVSELARATARIKYVDHFEAVHHLTPEHIQEALGRGKVRRAVWDALRASPVP
ncbi:hypothetical protein KDL45_04860, partial [bacterium]|nr:hypothetical protein [bacterium]